LSNDETEIKWRWYDPGRGAEVGNIDYGAPVNVCGAPKYRNASL